MGESQLLPVGRQSGREILQSENETQNQKKMRLILSALTYQLCQREKKATHIKNSFWCQPLEHYMSSRILSGLQVTHALGSPMLNSSLGADQVWRFDSLIFIHMQLYQKMPLISNIQVQFLNTMSS